MAKITLNGAQLQVDLTADEQDTCEGLPEGKLGGFLTLWLEEQHRRMISDQFATLTPQEKTQALALIRKQDQGGRPL